MEDITYDWLWNKIEKTIIAIEQRITDRYGDVLGLCNFRRTYGADTKNVIRLEYNKIRDELKSQCYLEADKEKIKEHQIDQHKIAACMCKAMINKKVFAFDVSLDLPDEIWLCNYRLAYTVSLQIIFLYLIDYYIKNDEEKAKQLMEQGTLMVPQTTQSHDEYNKGRIKTLALNDYYGNEINLLEFSDMLYWIEYYNRQILENKICL